MIIPTTKIGQKAIRAEIIADHVATAGLAGCVCFSCGNASKELKKIKGLKVLDISPHGDLEARRWWQPSEIQSFFPGYMDATSGHLPVYLMARIAERLRIKLQLAGTSYAVHSGSGETIMCLSMAFPNVKFVPVFGQEHGCDLNPESPLYAWLQRLKS